MWHHLIPALKEPEESPSRRKGHERIRYSDRRAGEGLSGAERQRAYRERYIEEHGAEAWRERARRNRRAQKDKKKADAPQQNNAERPGETHEGRECCH